MQLIEFLFVWRADPLLCHLDTAKKHIKKTETFRKANSKQQNFPKQATSQVRNLKFQASEHEKLWLLVSSLAYKELRSHHFILMSRKQAEKSTTLPIITRDRSTKLSARRANPELEARSCLRLSVDSSEWQLQGDAVIRETPTLCWVLAPRNPLNFPCERLQIQLTKPMSQKIQKTKRSPQTEISKALTASTRENPFMLPARGGGKKPFWNIPNILIFTRLDLGETLLLPESNYLREEK